MKGVLGRGKRNIRCFPVDRVETDVFRLHQHLLLVLDLGNLVAFCRLIRLLCRVEDEDGLRLWDFCHGDLMSSHGLAVIIGQSLMGV